MNLAEYLSELLSRYDEVSIPGLGYFVRERVNGYYNEHEAKFYPPYHQAKFIPEPKNDDIFVAYVADKKNISLASSKYFTEKFVSKVREQAAAGKYPFADLGSFQTDQDQNLVFKPYDKIASDQTFYGYAPVNISKSASTWPKLGFPEVPAFPEAGTPVAQEIESQEYIEEEPKRKRTWLIILLAITGIALAFFGVYTLYPDALNSTYNKITGSQDTAAHVSRHKKKVDTIKKAVPVTDTSSKTTVPAAQPADTVKHSNWEIIESSFWQLKRANAQVAHLKARGLDAKILTAAPGQLLRVSVGTYPTQKEADSVRTLLINTRKIRKHSQTLEINP